MKSMFIGSAVKPSSSSLRPPLVETACREKVHVSRVLQVYSKVKFGRLNHLPSCKLKYHQSADEYERPRLKVLATAHDSKFSNSPETDGKSLGAMLGVIYRYSKVYTVRGSVLSIISISLLAVKNLSDFTPSFFLGLLQAIIGGCLANLFVVGLNQLSDIDIDKVNKPHLPLASGELSVRAGIQLTSLYAILGFALGWSIRSWPLKLGLFLWYAIGTAYSVDLPLLRWKGSPTLTAILFFVGQGTIIPILFHLHAQTCVYGRSLLLSKHVIFVSIIMSIYGLASALIKDIPDIEGDKLHGINSLASRFGIKPVFWFCIWILETAYAMAILIGLLSPNFWIRSIMVSSHSILGFILWRQANLVDLESNAAVESFYMFIWKLYGVEYLLVPFLRF